MVDHFTDMDLFTVDLFTYILYYSRQYCYYTLCLKKTTQDFGKLKLEQF